MEVPINPTFKMVVKNKEIQTERYRKYRWKWYNHPKEFIIEDYPIHVDIETNTNCNLRCVMCIHSFDKPQYVEMKPELYRKVIDEGSRNGLCSIKTQYRGEPLLYKNTVDLVRYAKNSGIIEVMFNTNATLLDEQISKQLIDAGLDQLLCSVEGYTKDVYEKIRVGADFNKVLGNIVRFQRIKKELGVDKPLLSVQMVDTPLNHHTLQDSIGFWSKIADKVGVSTMIDYAMKEEDGSPLPNWACSQLWQRLFVLADGDVVPCCSGVAGGNTKLCVLGNAYDDSISDIWVGARLEKIRELHKTGNSHKITMCAKCDLRKNQVKTTKVNIRDG